MRAILDPLQYILAVLASVAAAGLVAVLGTWWAIVICIVTGFASLALIIRGVFRSRYFWAWVRRNISTYGSNTWPWEEFSRKAASDSPEESISALDEAIAFIENHPEQCLEALGFLHKTARPDMNSSVSVRQKYARFRLLAIRIMVESQPAIIGTVLATLKDLLQSRIEDVRASATTELGELCDLAGAPGSSVPKTWQNLCHELLNNTLIDFLNRKIALHAQSLIRYIASARTNPMVFREIFSNLVKRVVSDGECKAEYIEAVCDLFKSTLPDLLNLVSPADLQALQGCSNLCLHRSHFMSTDRRLRVFEDHNGDPRKNKRIWRRLGMRDGLEDLTISCSMANGNKCQIGCCKGADISMGGTNSSSCIKPEESQLTDLSISLIVRGSRRHFNIPRALVQRRYRDVGGNLIGGAGISFNQIGISKQDLETIYALFDPNDNLPITQPSLFH